MPVDRRAFRESLQRERGFGPAVLVRGVAGNILLGPECMLRPQVTILKKRILNDFNAKFGATADCTVKLFAGTHEIIDEEFLEEGKYGQEIELTAVIHQAPAESRLAARECKQQ
jgi:hypothetical protein